MTTQEKRSRKMSGAPTPLLTALLIDGELVQGQGVAEPILNPATGEVLTQIAEASTEQVESAILAAHRAFAGWSRTTPQQRSNILRGIADAIEICGDTLIHMKTLKVGDRRATGYEGEGFAIVKHPTTEGVKSALRTLIETVQIRYG